MKSTREKIEVLEHFEKGGDVEYRCKRESQGWEYVPCPGWDWMNNDYRIKPQPKFRPYTAEEFDKLGCIYLHGGKNEIRYTLKHYGNSGINITGGGDYSWLQVMGNFTHLDGSPCGVEVTE